MATAEQLKNLIKAHFDKDEEKFKTIALQIAAYEARHNHEVFAREIKSLIDRGLYRKYLKSFTFYTLAEK